MEKYWPFYISFGSYGLFVVYNLLVGYSKSTTPIRDFCIRHAVAFALEIPVLTFMALRFESTGFDRLAGVLIGLCYFFLLHYAIGLHLLGVAQRSISTNLLVTLLNLGGKCSVSQLRKNYGGDKTLDYVTVSRLKQMEDWQWICGDSEAFHVGEKGKLQLRISTFFMKLFSVESLGEDQS